MPPCSESARQCRVLVVDDDHAARTHLAAILQLAGYEVQVATCGAEAIRVLESTACQIVVTDWQMPAINAPELCRHLRLSDDSGYIYIVMWTARNASRDVLTGLAAGADDYVVKGTPDDEILARLAAGRRITHLESSLQESNREHRRLSITDPLTGAFNRRYLMKYLPRELERSRRYDHPLAVLSCDIDRFKRVNDTFGHEAGDDVLQAFVARSIRCLRDSADWIARSGGEEFIIVLPETDLQGATAVAEKLRGDLAATPIQTCAGLLVVTVSVGVTALETSCRLARASVAELLRSADRCLYQSKRSGRDRATAAQAVTLDPSTAHTSQEPAMTTIERWPPRSAQSAGIDERLDSVRDSFYSRLSSDRVNLTALSASLRRSEGHPGLIFEELRQFAHRLRGAAAIFEAVEVGRAAHDLEQAVNGALLARAPNSDPCVQATLEGLVDRLALLNGRPPSLPRNDTDVMTRDM